MKVIASLVCVLLSSQSIKVRKMKDLLVFSLLELCFQDNVNVYISVFLFFFAWIAFVRSVMLVSITIA